MMFERYELNETGKAKVEALTEAFQALMATINAIHVVNSRERALMLTKLQEAGFYATRAVAMDFANRMPPSKDVDTGRE